MLANLLFAIYNGMAAGMAIFLVAAGLTWIFGILNILNMAHGHFFMIGAYLAFTLLGRHPESFDAFLGAALVAALVVGTLGYLIDKLLFQRLRKVDYHYVIIATFALVTVIEGVARMIWGGTFHAVSPPPFLEGAVEIGSQFVAKTTLFAIVAGTVVFIVLDLIIQRTWTGKLMQAAARDPWMASILGINVPTLLTASVVASFALAGAAGALLLPLQSLSLELGGSSLLLAFFAVIIGGLGSVRGALAASLLLGLVDNVGNVLLPNFPGMSIFLALLVFLVGWPQGIVPPKG
jgi:branched-chain amino acid transport system permease protein